MRTNPSTITQTLAASAAALFLTACEKGSEGVTPDDASAADASPVDANPVAVGGEVDVHCFGINECKGQSACDVKDAHVCAGQNECAAKGWIVVSKADCAEKGGTEV